MNKKDKSIYVFNIKLISLGISIICILILAITGLFLGIVGIVLTELILWVALTIQEIKISLLQEIANNVKNK